MEKNLLKEEKAHGDYYFPLRISSFSVTPACDGLAELFHVHWHNEYEFFHVTEGKALLSIGETKVEVLTGQAVFINSAELHCGYIIDNSNCTFYATVFADDFISSKNYDIVQDVYISNIQKKLGSFIHLEGNCSWEKEILSQLLKIENEYKNKYSGFQFKIKACLYDIFYELFANLAFRTNVEHYSINNKIKKVLDYIHEYYYLKLNCKMFASLINLNEDYFRHYFKLTLGKTPVEYLNLYRINLAIGFLKDENYKIIDVALKTGFNNMSYFTKVFKDITNYTPKEFRKKYQSIN